MVATIAVRLPALGLVLIVTVSDVAVDAVTAPTAPLLNVTAFCPGVVLNPVPVTVMVAAFAEMLELTAVTVGAVEVATTCASWTAVPLEIPFAVTEPISVPTAVGLLVSRTVREVVEAAVTRPTGTPVNVTVSLVISGLNPKPLMTKLVPLSEKLLVLVVTTGLMVAT